MGRRRSNAFSDHGYKNWHTPPFGRRHSVIPAACPTDFLPGYIQNWQPKACSFSLWLLYETPTASSENRFFPEGKLWVTFFQNDSLGALPPENQKIRSQKARTKARQRTGTR
jgi:hypothetical protein